MSRNTHNKLSTILQQLRASGTLYGRRNPQPPSSRQQSLSRPTPPSSPAHQAQAQASTFRGHFDQGHAVSLSLPETEYTHQETENIVSGFSLSEDFDMDFGTPEIIGFGHGFSNAASVHMGGDSHQGVRQGGQSGSGDFLNGVRQGGQNGSGGALQQDSRFGNRFQQQPQHHLELEDAPMDDMDEEDFDEDLDAILNSQPQHRQGASRQFSEEVVPPAPKTFEQPKAHTLFDKMAQGMEYATTFDVGSVNLSSVFDQFDTAMEVKEMTKAPLKTKHDSQDMAEMFSQFDRQMSVEKTPAPEPEPSEEESQQQVVTKGPTWRPRNPKITNYEELLEDIPASLYLLEKSNTFMNEVIAPFDTGRYARIPLHFETYRSTDVEKAAGFGIIQVRIDEAWVNLNRPGLNLSGRAIDWDNDIRIVIGMNMYARNGQDSVGNRMSTVVHELGLHGLSHAALIDRHRTEMLSVEDLRVAYVKRILLEIDHLSIMGELAPLNRTYERINADVLAILRGNPKWLEVGSVNKDIFSDHPDLVEAFKEFKHLQKPSQKRHFAPIWFQYMCTVNLERRNVYNPANPMNFLGVNLKDVKRDEIDQLLRASEADVRAWVAARPSRLPDNERQDPARRIVVPAPKP